MLEGFVVQSRIFRFKNIKGNSPYTLLKENAQLNKNELKIVKLG